MLSHRCEISGFRGIDDGVMALLKAFTLTQKAVGEISDKSLSRKKTLSGASKFAGAARFDL